MIRVRTFLIAGSLVLCASGCSRHDAAVMQPPLPKGAVVVPIGKVFGWDRLTRGVWIGGGDPDAPWLRLMAVHGQHYDAFPMATLLDLRCDPWARGLVFGSGAVALGLKPPTLSPGDELALSAGEVTLHGPVHPRTYGWSDTSSPGTFIPADAVDLHRLALARALTVTWGARRVSLPAPPAAVFANFATRCAAAFDFGRWPPADRPKAQP